MDLCVRSNYRLQHLGLPWSNPSKVLIGAAINTALYYNHSDPAPHMPLENGSCVWQLTKSSKAREPGTPTDPKVILLILDHSVPLSHPFWWDPEDPKGPAQSLEERLQARRASGSWNTVHISLIKLRALALRCSTKEGRHVLLYLPREDTLCARRDLHENLVKVSIHLKKAN